MIVHSMPATGVELDSELEREKAKYELNGREVRVLGYRG